MSIFFSRQFSFFVLRTGLAVVFIWLGIDKLSHPGYWLNTWLPPWTSSLLVQTKITTHQLIYFLGFLEILAGFCLVSGIFIKPVSFLTALFLMIFSFTVGFDETAVRNIGLISGLLSILFWPKKNGHF